jgi:hypothetical protein
MNKEQQELVNEAYKNYRSKSKDIDLPENLYNKLIDALNTDAMFPIDYPNRMLTKEEFINKCKTDSEFSERWGLRIKERELSLEERDDLKLKLILDYLKKKGITSSTFEDFKNDEKLIPNIDWRREVWDLSSWIDYGNSIQRNRLKEIYDDIKIIPTRLITITYNNKTIESYE